MKNAGIAVGLGVLLLVIALFMDASVSSGSSFLASDRIINIGLLQNQLMAWQAGLAAIVAGCALLAGGEIAESMQRGRPIWRGGL